MKDLQWCSGIEKVSINSKLLQEVSIRPYVLKFSKCNV